MVSKNNRAIVRGEAIQRKVYLYTKGSIELKFTLRNDIKQEMKDFKELMQVAIQEIDEDIAKLTK